MERTFVVDKEVDRVVNVKGNGGLKSDGWRDNPTLQDLGLLKHNFRTESVKYTHRIRSIYWNGSELKE